MSLQDLHKATDYIQKQAAKGGGGGAAPGIMPMGKMFHPTQWFQGNPFAGVATAAGLGGAALGYLNSDDSDWKDALAGGALGVGAAGLLNQMGAFGGMAGKGNKPQGEGNRSRGDGDQNQGDRPRNQGDGNGNGNRSRGDGNQNQGGGGGGSSNNNNGGGGGNNRGGGNNNNNNNNRRGGNNNQPQMTDAEKKILESIKGLPEHQQVAWGKSVGEMRRQRELQQHLAQLGEQNLKTNEAVRAAKANREIQEQLNDLTGAYSSNAGMGLLRRLKYRLLGG